MTQEQTRTLQMIDGIRESHRGAIDSAGCLHYFLRNGRKFFVIRVGELNRNLCKLGVRSKRRNPLQPKKSHDISEGEVQFEPFGSQPQMCQEELEELWHSAPTGRSL